MIINWKLCASFLHQLCSILETLCLHLYEGDNRLPGDTIISHGWSISKSALFRNSFRPVSKDGRGRGDKINFSFIKQSFRKTKCWRSYASLDVDERLNTESHETRSGTTSVFSALFPLPILTSTVLPSCWSRLRTKVRRTCMTEWANLNKKQLI